MKEFLIFYPKSTRKKIWGDGDKLVKTFYEKYRLPKNCTFLSYKFLSAYKRIKNLKDMLISAS